MSEKRISRKELANRNRKQNKKRKNIRILMIAAMTAVLLYITGIYGTSLAYFGDIISGGLSVIQLGSGWPYEGDFSSLVQSDGMGTGLCVLTQDEFSVYSPTAKNIFTYSHSMQNPMMSTSTNRAVIYDLNRTSLKIANSHNILFSQEMGNNIIHADISKSNRVAVTTRSSSYNGEVTVFNYDMKERFVWYCADGFPVYSHISDSGKVLAVNAVKTENGMLYSRIYLIDSAHGTELYSIDSGSYPMQLKFISDDKLLIAYINKLVLWNVKNNAQIAEYDFNGEDLLAIEYNNPYIAVSYGSYDGRESTLVLLSQDFDEKLSVQVPEKVKNVSVSSSRLYALGEENLYEYDYSSNLLNTIYTGVLSKQLVSWKGTVLIDSTEILKVKKTKSR